MTCTRCGGFSSTRVCHHCSNLPDAVDYALVETLQADLKAARKIAWEWAQGVTDAETAIRQLNRMFPIDDSTKSAA